MRRTVLRFSAGLLLSTLLGAVPSMAQTRTEISLYYPIAVGGTMSRIINRMVNDFEKSNPDVKVNAVYSGNYQESLAKALAAHKSGTPPTVAVLQATDLFSLIDEGAIVPIDQLAKPEDKAWLNGFFKSFMLNSQTDGKTWGIPFQRSTIVMFYNKNMFKAAGLDPEKAPATWNEMLDAAKKLTKSDSTGVTQWGIKLPSSGFPYWIFQGLTTANDTVLMNSSGTATYFDKPGAVEALQYWVDLSAKHKVMPAGVIEWGSIPLDFLQEKVGIVWTSTGNLANLREKAKFPFGVAMLPANKRRGSPTGGANFYVFSKASPEQQQAAMRFIRWATDAQHAAEWSIGTGYVATRQDAWDTPEMKKYVQEVPGAAVARDQLQHSVAELSTHEGARVTKVLNDGVQAALSGAKTPEAALKEAQQEADRILRSVKR